MSQLWAHFGWRQFKSANILCSIPLVTVLVRPYLHSSLILKLLRTTLDIFRTASYVELQKRLGVVSSGLSLLGICSCQDGAVYDSAGR